MSQKWRHYDVITPDSGGAPNVSDSSDTKVYKKANLSNPIKIGRELEMPTSVAN